MTQPPPHSPVTPHLTVRDAAAAIDFYVRAFGAIELDRQPAPDGRLIHAAIEVNGGHIYLNDDFPEMGDGITREPGALGGTPVTIHLTIADVDAAWERAVAAGAEVAIPLADMFWGSRYGVLQDPFGHSWSLGTPQQPMSREELEAATAEAFGQQP